MGGFDFSYSQRQTSSHLEINSQNKKIPKQSPIKKQVLPLQDASLLEGQYLQLTPELLEDLSLYKRIVKKYTTLLLTSMLVGQVQQLIRNSSTSSCHPTSNYRDSTQEEKQESVHISLQLLNFFTDIKEILEHISLLEDMTFSVLIQSCLVPKESTFKFTQLFLFAICHNGFRFSSRHDNILVKVQR